MGDILIQHVSKTYPGGNTVLHDIDLTLPDGDFLVILGPSGCGKSTLLRMIAGLEEISEGDIHINGRHVNKLAPRDRGCAMVFQNYALYPHMTVDKNIGYSLKISGVPKAERQQRIQKTADMLGLGELLKRKPAELSGGQRQRVAIGRAMIREPRVFLFDEPLSNLDAKLRVQMRAEIRRLHQRLKTTSVFVTHDQVEAMTLADRMIVMKGGHVEQFGTPEDIYQRPASTFVADFVGSPPMNLFKGTVTKTYIETEHGSKLPLPDSIDLTLGPVTLGIRPEALNIADAHETSASRHLPTVEDAVRIQVELDFVEELGAERAVYGRAGNSTIAVTTSAPIHQRPGDMIELYLQCHDLHYFNASTGKRIPSEYKGSNRQEHSPADTAASRRII